MTETTWPPFAVPPGVASLGGVWTDYTPLLDSAHAAGFPGGTPPVLGTGGNAGIRGRYLYVPSQKLCQVEFAVVFGNTGNAAGTTTSILNGVYVVSLPVPMAVTGSGIDGDRPIGFGKVGSPAIGIPIFTNMPCEWTLSDNASDNHPELGRGSWAQAFVPQVIVTGAGTWGAGETSHTITLPFPLLFPPTPPEIAIQFTGPPSTSMGTVAIATAGITTTQFVATCKTAPGGAGVGFSYKIRSETAIRLCGAAPWNVGATAGDGFNGVLQYETAI